MLDCDLVATIMAITGWTIVLTRAVALHRLETELNRPNAIAPETVPASRN